MHDIAHLLHLWRQLCKTIVVRPHLSIKLALLLIGEIFVEMLTVNSTLLVDQFHLPNTVAMT
jgi:hypothetical protein